MVVELIVDETASAPRPWAGGPIPEEHVLAGFHGVTLLVTNAERSVRLLTEQMGYRLVGQEGARSRLKANGDAAGGHVDLLERPGLAAGRMGAGSHHHVAFRGRDDAEEVAYQQSIRTLALT